jgi:RHS repeat-associated protein
MTNRISVLGRIRVRATQGAQSWLRPFALLGVMAASCGERAQESSPQEAVAKAQEAVVDLNVPLAPGEYRSARLVRLPFNGGPPISDPAFDVAARGLQPIPSLASGTGAQLHIDSYPSSGYWIAHKNSPNQGEWVSHLLKAKLPTFYTPTFGHGGGFIWLTHSLFIPTGTAGPGGVVASDPPGLVNGQGFVQPAPEGGALLNPVVSAPGNGANGTRPNWTSGPADTGVALRTIDAYLARVGIVQNEVVQRSYLFEVKVNVPSHPERAGAVVGNALRPLVYLQRGGQELVTGGNGMFLTPIDFSAYLDQWVTLQIRADVTTAGGATTNSSDDVVRVKYLSYVDGQLCHTDEPVIDASVLQAQTGPIALGPGFALLRGHQGDAPEAFLDELEIHSIGTAPPVRSGESLKPTPEWTETFGSRNDGAGSSLAGFKFVPYSAPSERSVRLYDPTTAQASGTTVIAYKGTPDEIVTEYVPHFAPGANCTTTPLLTDCIMPGGGVFDGTALWVSHSRFLPQSGSLGPPPIGMASPPAVGRRYDGTDVPADTHTIVRPADERLFQLEFQDGATLRKSYLVSADFYVPSHVGTREWFRIGHYITRGLYGDPTWGSAIETEHLGIQDKWHRLHVRIDATTYGGGAGTTDDKADVYLHYLVDLEPGSHKNFGGVYVKLDVPAAAGTGNLKFGPTFGVWRGYQLDAVEAFLDNFSAHEILLSKTCDDDTDCTNGQVCGASNGELFGLPTGTRVCWDATCDAPETAECGSVQARCGVCRAGSACTSDANCFQSTCTDGVCGCTPSCTGKACGADDGCGATCSCVGEICIDDENCVDGTRCDSGTCKPIGCVTSADCPQGQVCGSYNGAAFDVDASNVCWSDICETSEREANCGPSPAACGECICSPNCDGKVCGGNTSDGCGAQCVGLCADREAGCANDADCQYGSVCIIGGGPRVGLAPGTNVCLPRECADHDPSRVPCGLSTDTCGLCPACSPDCVGRCGGAPDGCGGECTAGCPGDESCSAAGVCMPPAPVTSASIPDGLGGMRSVDPLDPGVTSPIGTMPGRLSVTEKGQAAYAIPIRVPPGMAGIAPSLSFQYVSDRMNGALGVGWRLQGLSAIDRCKKTVGQDGYAAQIADDATDSFCLDGKRLEAGPAQPYGGDGASHFPELDPRTKVVSHTPSGASGPAYFTVFRDDGLIYTYGSTNNSSVYASVVTGMKRTWALDRVQDRLGNDMVIQYLKIDAPAGVLTDDGTRELLPLAMYYGGHVGAGPQRRASRSVQFRYSTTRPDLLQGYAYGGHTTFRTRRLEQVMVLLGAQVVRTYELTYGDDPTVGNMAYNGVSRLARITERGGDGVALPATEFGYYDEGDYAFEQAVERTSLILDDDAKRPPEISAIKSGFAALGSAHDGRSALFYEKDNLPCLKITNADGVSCGDQYAIAKRTSPSGAVPGNYQSLTIAGSGIGAYYRPAVGPVQGCQNDSHRDDPEAAHVGSSTAWDIDFDGRVELIDFWPVDRGQLRFLAQNGPTAFGSWFANSLPRPTKSLCDRSSYTPADVTGEGKLDIALCHPNNSILLFRNVLDAGAHEVLPGWGECPEPPEDTRFPTPRDITFDVDGDGTANLVRHDEEQGMAALYFRADNGLAEWRTFMPAGITTDLSGSIPIDFNGDGLKDLLRIPDGGFEVWGAIFQNQGGRLELLPVDVHNVSPPLLGPMARRRAMVFDFNRDGREDILYPTANGTDWVVATIRDDGTVWPLDYVHIPYVPWTSGGTDQTPEVRSALGDFDGDLDVDLALLDKDSRLHVLYGRGERTNLLRFVTDGLGKRHELTYSPHAYEPVEPGTTCAPQRCLMNAGMVVATITEAAVGGVPTGAAPRGERSILYTYRDARVDPSTGKWLGFSSREILTFSHNGTLLGETYVEMDNTTMESGRYPLAGRKTFVRARSPLVENSDLASDQYVRQSETTYNWLPVVSSVTGHLMPVLESWATRVEDVIENGTEDLERHVLTTGMSFDRDAYGNPQGTVRYARVRPNQGTMVTLSHTVTGVEYDTTEVDQWLIDRPKSVTILDQTLDGATSTQHTKYRVTEFTYYPGTTLLHTVTREPTDPVLMLKQTLGRDDFGNIDEVIETTAAGTSGPVRTTSVTYDVYGIFPVTVTNAVGHATYFATDPRYGLKTLVADANGVAVQAAYDSFGRMTRQLSATSDTVVGYELAVFDDSGPVPSHGVMAKNVETAGRGSSRVTIDSFGREVRSQRTGLFGKLVETETMYDDAGRLFRQSRPHLPFDVSQGFLEYTYDELGNLEQVEFPDASTIELDYASHALVDPNALGGQTPSVHNVWYRSLKNQRGFTDVTVVDSRNDFVASRDAAGGWVTVARGPFGIELRRSAAGAETTLVMNAYGQLQSRNDPDRGLERYEYTPWGELDAYWAGGGANPTLDYEYDGIGRVESIVSPEGTTSFFYDIGPGPNDLGRPVRMLSSDGVERTFEYEPVTIGANRGLLSAVVDTVDGVTMRTEYTHNNFGQLDVIRYPGGSSPFVVQHDYDASGNLEAVGTEGFITGTGETFWQLQDDHQGYLMKAESIGLSVTTRTFDQLTGQMGHLVTRDQFGQITRETEHTWDLNGNLDTRTDLRTGGPAEEFGYDALDRLTTVHEGATTGLSAQYYGDGSMWALDGEQLTYDHPDGSPAHGPRTLGSNSFIYDDRGNQTTRTGPGVQGGVQTLTYNSFGLPTTVTVGQAPATTTFKYGADGSRARKVRADQSSVFYSGEYERRVSSAGTEHVYQIYGASGPVAQIVRGTGDQELSRTYWHGDVVGSPELITDESGAVLHRQKFSAYGKVTNPSWESSNPAVRRVTRGFTGHEHDPESGLINMRARLYDPRVARFISPDPVLSDVGWTQAHNRFSYVWNNPLTFVDPSGLEGEPTINGEPADIGMVVGEGVVVQPPPTDDYWDPLPDGDYFEEVAEFDELTAPSGASEPMAEFGPPPAPSEWGERVQWDDPPVAHQSLAPKVGHEILSQPEFHGEDSSEFWESVLAWVTLPGAPELGIGAALTGVLGTVLTRVAPRAARGLVGIPGRVATRINLSNAGMKHVLDVHLNPAKAINKSQWFGSEATVRGLLSAKSTIQSPVRLLDSGNFARTVTNATPVGTLPGKWGGGATNVFTVISDDAGNLLSAFPGTL